MEPGCQGRGEVGVGSTRQCGVGQDGDQSESIGRLGGRQLGNRIGGPPGCAPIASEPVQQFHTRGSRGIRRPCCEPGGDIEEGVPYRDRVGVGAGGERSGERGERSACIGVRGEIQVELFADESPGPRIGERVLGCRKFVTYDTEKGFWIGDLHGGEEGR